MERDWLDGLQTQERVERERQIQEAAARNRLIYQEAPKIFERLLASFKTVAANCRVSGVTLRFDRPEQELGRVIATIDRGVAPLRTGVNIQFFPESQEVKCTSEVGGTQTFYFGVTFGAVSLYHDGRRISKIDTVCEMALKPLLSAARALH
jgi:hypothetical protein